MTLQPRGEHLSTFYLFIHISMDATTLNQDSLTIILLFITTHAEYALIVIHSRELSFWAGD